MTTVSDGWWIVEIDQGFMWTPVGYCASQKAADDLAKAAHIEAFGKPARVREYGKPAVAITAGDRK